MATFRKNAKGRVHKVPTVQVSDAMMVSWLDNGSLDTRGLCVAPGKMPRPKELWRRTSVRRGQTWRGKQAHPNVVGCGR